MDAYFIFVFLILVPAIYMIVSCFEGREMREYLESHPPISDEEFLKLCSPDVDPTIALKVLAILSDVSGIDESQIYPEARIICDLGLY